MRATGAREYGVCTQEGSWFKWVQTVPVFAKAWGGAPNVLCAPGTVQQVQSAENSQGMSSRDQKTPGDSVDVSVVYDRGTRVQLVRKKKGPGGGLRKRTDTLPASWAGDGLIVQRLSRCLCQI